MAATLVVTVTADDGTSQQVTVSVPVETGLYPGPATYPGPTTFPGK